MPINGIKTTLTTAAITLALAVPSAAMAYDEDDAIKDCEKRLGDEYQLTDFRHESAEKLPGEGHKYKVTGNTKVDGDKYDFSCEIKDRHVTSVNYEGPEKEEMSDAKKAAVGVAAVVAAAAIASKIKEGDEDEKDDFDDLQDLVGTRASSGEQELEDHGYDHYKTLKVKDSSLAYWWNSSRDRCIVVTTKDGHYESAVDQNEVMCGK